MNEWMTDCLMRTAAESRMELYESPDNENVLRAVGGGKRTVCKLGGDVHRVNEAETV